MSLCVCKRSYNIEIMKIFVDYCQGRFQRFENFFDFGNWKWQVPLFILVHESVKNEFIVRDVNHSIPSGSMAVEVMNKMR